MLIDQELSNLDKHFTLQLADIQEYVSELKTPGFCKEIDDFNAYFSEEDTSNRFTLEISLVHVTTNDESFANDLREAAPKIVPSKRPYYTIPMKNWYVILDAGLNQFDIMRYQKVLLKHFKRLLNDNLIERLTIQMLVRGPILYRVEEEQTNTDYDDIYEQDDEYYDESMTGLLAHPFTKLPRMRVSNEEKPLKSEIYTFSIEFKPEELFNKINQELTKIPIIQGDKILFTIEEEILPLFNRWVADRQTQENIGQHISQLYPLLTSVQFLAQLQEWTSLGKQIIKETELLNNQIQLLTQNSAFDLQTIEILMKEAWSKEGREILTREEVLDRWVMFMQVNGDTRSHDYLKKNILRPRLKMVIEKIKQNTDLESNTIVIFKDATEKSGKPATMFKLKPTT